MASSASFHLRPSAQPFISCRLRPSPKSPHGLHANAAPVLAVREGQTGLQEVAGASALAEKEAFEAFARLPSVGTWMLMPSPKARRGLDTWPAEPQMGVTSLVKCADTAADPDKEEDGRDARLMNLIAQASEKHVPLVQCSILKPEMLDFKEAARFRPSVGTWLKPRQTLAAIPPSSLAVLSLREPKDERYDLKVPLADSRPAIVVPEVEDSLELHFFHLDFRKADSNSVKNEILHGLMEMGCHKGLLSNMRIKLRAGSPGCIAEIQGAGQHLKSIDIYSLKVMGCQAQSAASAAAQAVTAGVMPSIPMRTHEKEVHHINLVSSDDPREQAKTTVTGAASQPTSLSSSPSARQPLLAENQGHGASPGVGSRTPFLSGTPTRDPSSPGGSRPFGFRRHAMPPTERRKAGPRRLWARDSWNVEELRISDIMSRSMESEGSELIDPGLEEEELQDMLLELYSEDTDADSVRWTFQLASRGSQRCTSTSNLHYAFRAHHYCHFLPQEIMRTLATTNVASSGAVDSALLQQLLEDLNDGYTVPAAEVKAVLDEADALAAAGGSGRASLLRAISAWYLNVVRNDSPWSTTLKACYGRWIPKKGYHLEVFGRLRSSIVNANEAFHEEHNPDSAGQAVWFLIQAAIFLVALVLPFGFFLWLIVLGAEHGDDRCPKDLDGLITWFGSLGLASLVVGWLDESLIAQSEDQLVKASSIGLALKVVLLIMPWVGAFWTFHLASNDQQTCGLFLTGASSLLWTVLLIAELAFGFAFLWHLAVFSEHEMTLRKGHQHPV
ncbi:unnamed protein product [Durusdinium trenchii]|uniref:Uncharacterized protein n=1 Tax=Durusdinium trenchii TaxID=1381693 RepID=A0ABP0IAP5_9DINO